jgi:transposase
MARKMETPQGKSEFAKRKEAAEWPFGNIKQNLKFTEFFTRGLPQTETEKNLITTSHNIKRMYNEIQKKMKTKYQQNT